MKKKIYLGIIGAGTVGRKLVHLFYQNKSIIESKIGAGIEISAVCDASASALSRLRAIVESIFKKSHGIKFLTSWQKVVEDPKIDIIIELIGGLSPAKEIVISALKKNKNVVTANKAVLAENWDEIFRLARKSQKLVYFEASAGAGIPVIQALNEGLAGNRISSVVGILNGTTNYLLTKMSKDNIEFSGALKLARKSGFAEANPKNDIQGTDTAHKLSILSSIAWSCWIKPSDIYTEGIAGLSVTDIKYAQTEFGYVIKLLGVARRMQNKLEIFVRPCLIPENAPFASVENEYNAVLIDGDACGEIIFYGRGAGGGPAASAVLSDIMFLSRQVAAGTAGRIPYVNYPHTRRSLKILSVEESSGCYYLRFTTLDKPGVLAKIADVLAKNSVSIAGVYQKEPLFQYRGRGRGGVPILMLTHRTKEKNIRLALQQIDKLPIVKAKTILLRIEGE